ncbi:sensor histidine kinase [Frigoribacterium sp. 2-23]|uniref:sensor histidine kinase n=1 Tax=Frigoribacterium sp. 2-23 TaxID=3415006 RepID=UPI003C7035A2
MSDPSPGTPRPPRRRRRPWTIATRLFVVQLVFVVLVGAVATAWTVRSARADADRSAARACLALATSIADNPFVLEALSERDPSATLQPYAVDLMSDTSTDFVTIMSPDRTRLTHPDPAEIGRPFVGTIAPALEGHAFTETYAGTLGPSVRAVVPIEDSSGTVVALAAAGVTVDSITGALAQRLPLVYAAALATVAIGALLSWLLARYLRRVTAGRGPEELSRMFAYYESVLHSVREGLVLVDDRRRLTLYNDQAAELLGIDRGADPAGRDLADLDLPESLAELLSSGRQAVDEVHVADDRIVVVNQERTRTGRGGLPLGTVTTLRDHTELTRLAGEMKTLRTLSDALRSQTHEFANRLHTITALIELGRADEALRFATSELESGQRDADTLVVDVDEPALSALLLGKSATARERSVRLHVDVDPELGRVDLPAGDLVTILGNLLDNAFDAVAPTLDAVHPRPDRAEPSGGAVPANRRAPVVRVAAWRDDHDSVHLEVSDTGPGLDDVERAFDRGFSTKAAVPGGRGIGLALVRQAVARAGGSIDVDTGSHGTTFSVTLPTAGRATATASRPVGGGER